MKEQIIALLPQEHPWRDRIHWYDTIRSTNTRAKELAAQGAPHGTVLIADSQSGGRGRMGRSFQSPGGVGVYMSVILRPQCQPDQLMHLTCAAAVAAREAVENACGLRPGIKWTNDLVWGLRKIAGILTELVILPGQVCAVVGIGINCCQEEGDFPEEIRGMAGSLAMATGKRIDRAKVAAELIRSLEGMDRQLLSGQTQMIECYREHCVTLGKEVSLVRGEDIRHGFALDICEDGALLVRFADGHQEAIASGEVSVRGMYGYI